MKKTNIAIYSILEAIGLSALIFGFIYFIKSYSFYQDEYGTSISFNYDYAILIITGILLSFYVGYKLYAYFIHNQLVDHDYDIFLAISVLFSFYTLGEFFKKMFKALSKNKFDFFAIQNYLYVGLITLAIAIVFGILLIKKYKKKSINK